MSGLQLFAQLVKVDEAKRQITGIIANEAVDRHGEIFDYETSKPNFIEWSNSISKASGGKSVGNVRAQHGKIVAGRLNDIIFSDVEKQISVTAEVVDDNEWNKVLKGCYTGFSIGGAYGDKWKDPALGKTRYTAKPAEVSIVDLPANPDASFSFLKADGSEEMLKFHIEPLPVLTEFEELCKRLEDAGMLEELEMLEKVAERADVNPKEGESKYGDVTFADAKNKKYPIDTPAHIRAAWNYINKPKNSGKYSGSDARSIKAKIVAAWKRKIDSAGPPSLAKALEGKSLEKGMWTVARLAEVISSVFCIQQDVAAEAASENDGSVLPDELKDAVTDLGEILCHMADEELSELFGPENTVEPNEPMEASMKPEELKKAADDAVNAAVASAFSSEALQKNLGGVIAEALNKAVEPIAKSQTEQAAKFEILEKMVKEQAEKLEKYAKTPVAGGPKFFGLTKEQEVAARGEGKVAPVVLNGEVNAAATLLKSIHAAGGVPETGRNLAKSQ